MAGLPRVAEPQQWRQHGAHLDLRDQVLQEAQPAGVLDALQLLADALRDGSAASSIQRLRPLAAEW
jgi:hypothetical protein